MIYKFFDKKTSGSGIKNKNMSDQRASNLPGLEKVSGCT